MMDGGNCVEDAENFFANSLMKDVCVCFCAYFYDRLDELMLECPQERHKLFEDFENSPLKERDCVKKFANV